jgi:Na+/phosphate symporter
VDGGDEDALDKEQEYLDRHSDAVTALQLRLQKLTSVTAKVHDPTSSTTYKTLSRKLLRLERNLHTASDDLDAMHDAPDLSLVELHSEQLHDDKKTLSTIYDDILALDLEDDDPLFDRHPEIERLLPTQGACAHLLRNFRRCHN